MTAPTMDQATLGEIRDGMVFTSDGWMPHLPEAPTPQQVAQMLTWCTQQIRRSVDIIERAEVARADAQKTYDEVFAKGYGACPSDKVTDRKMAGEIFARDEKYALTLAEIVWNTAKRRAESYEKTLSATQSIKGLLVAEMGLGDGS